MTDGQVGWTPVISTIQRRSIDIHRRCQLVIPLQSKLAISFSSNRPFFSKVWIEFSPLNEHLRFGVFQWHGNRIVGSEKRLQIAFLRFVQFKTIGFDGVRLSELFAPFQFVASQTRYHFVNDTLQRVISPFKIIKLVLLSAAILIWISRKSPELRKWFCAAERDATTWTFVKFRHVRNDTRSTNFQFEKWRH